MHATLTLFERSDFPAITRAPLQTLQVNLGYRCNQSCLHCHVNAGPQRTESMPLEIIADVVKFIEASSVRTLDITGGAPELNPYFRHLVSQARALGSHVIDRCNLTILEQPGQHDLAQFLADNHVEVIASLPCYSAENVDRQRGKGVFDSSIRALQTLNALGYGCPHSALKLNLVYNPQGAVLPPPQEQLAADYREQLLLNYGIVFDQLYVLANMPIQRFGSTLVSKGEFKPYMDLLKRAHQPHNVANVMCRTLISVDWRGYVYDCDFNQMLGLPLSYRAPGQLRLRDLMGNDLTGNPIAVKNHCYGCTAGQGSSCGGALTSVSAEISSAS